MQKFSFYHTKLEVFLYVINFMRQNNVTLINEWNYNYCDKIDKNLQVEKLRKLCLRLFSFQVTFQGFSEITDGGFYGLNFFVISKTSDCK